MKAVSPHSTLAIATGLGQPGDTAVHGKLWRGEEQEDQEMRTEQTEQKPDENAREKEDEEEEEADVPNTRRAPKGPTQKERAEHEATHIPYRDWCRHCVRGRATNRPHRSTPVE